MSDPSKERQSRSDSAGLSAQALLEVIEELLLNTPGAEDFIKGLNLDSHMEVDLGLDSLARTELLSRINDAFDVLMPDQALLAETPRELLNHLAQAAGVPTSQAEQQRVEAAGHGAGLPSSAMTLVEVLDWHLEHQPERVHIELYGSDEEPDPISYADLGEGAGRVAAGLWEHRVRPGDRVALMLPTERSYFFSFYGILLAGAIPVPIYPPTRLSQLEEHLRRHGKILQNAGVRLLITFPEAGRVAQLLKSLVPSLRHVVDWSQLDQAGGGFQSTPRRGEDIAFLQYTSGSTGDPKGVILSHDNLLANIRAMGKAVEVSSQDVFVSWLPLYHDMGLIGAWFGSLYYGLPLVVMSPLRFLARPSRWLWAIHRHRGTLSASPNFGYELCLSKVPEEELEGLDLSSWRYAFNGAEPVSATTLQGFTERFKSYGFDGQALAPVYGLAEAAVGLAFPPPRRGPLIDRISRDSFMLNGEASPAKEGEKDPLSMVACGRALPGYKVQVVDRSGHPLPERREGRLEFQGPSSTAGYFEYQEASSRLFRNGWLDTGDRAYLADGDIFITGRIKEMMIRGGRNIYPYELERLVGELEGIRKGCVAVFPSDDPNSGTERLVVVAESRERDPKRQEALRRGIRECTGDLLGMPPDDVVVVPPHTVLKTSSGKLRRGTMRALYEQGELEQGQRPLALQIVSLLLSGLGLRFNRLRLNTGRYLFAAYAWIVFSLLVPLVWLSVVTLPRLSWRWRVIRLAIRVLRRLTGTPLSVEGLEKLPAAGDPLVLVANHASYLDTLMLIDAIPREFVYVAKQELAQRFFSRLFLQRLDTLFVERFDVRRSADMTGKFADLLAQGRSLAFYPEATFRAEPGLMPFHMGAFVAAAESGVPVVPVAIRGTRAILQDESKFPRHGAVQVVVEDSLWPRDSGWAEAARMRSEARMAIARQCGEKTL
jgi:1-acyl-sn-glycerol-3-phosphate acyltransferase